MTEINGAKREDVTGGWKMCSVEVHDLHCLPDIRVIKSGTMRCVWHVAHIGEQRSTGIWHMWEDNIKINLK